MVYKRTFSKLEKAGFLLTANYNKNPRDKTKWYSLDLERIFELQEMVKIKRSSLSESRIFNWFGLVRFPLSIPFYWGFRVLPNK